MRGRPKISVSGGPSHGSVALVVGDAHPAFPPGSALHPCNAATVPSASVTYTPRAGFVGGDAVTIEDVDADGRRKAVRFMIRVL